MHFRFYFALPLTLIALTACGSNSQTNAEATAAVTNESTTGDTAPELGSITRETTTSTNAATSIETSTTLTPTITQTNSSAKTTAPNREAPTTAVRANNNSYSTTIAPNNSSPTTTKETSTPGSFDFECDAESDSAPTFTVPFGSSVKIVVTSSAEREFHLHGYDIELSGTRVTFNFTADIGGRNMVSIHPNHDVVCYINVQ
jgi:hypothetical protein